MHELAIAQHLVRLVEAQAAATGAGQVTQINVSLGEQSHVVAASLAFYVEMLTSESSPARGARLEVTRLPARFYCEACALEYAARNGRLTCPRCRGFGTLTDAGDGLVLESLEVTG